MCRDAAAASPAAAVSARVARRGSCGCSRSGTCRRTGGAERRWLLVGRRDHDRAPRGMRSVPVRVGPGAGERVGRCASRPRKQTVVAREREADQWLPRLRGRGRASDGLQAFKRSLQHSWRLNARWILPLVVFGSAPGRRQRDCMRHDSHARRPPPRGYVRSALPHRCGCGAFARLLNHDEPFRRRARRGP